MKWTYFLVAIFFLFFTCKVKKELPLDLATDQAISIRIGVKKFVKCLNERDEPCLQQIFHQDYRGISPIVDSQRKNEFIKAMIHNFEQNNLQASAEIKSIEMGQDMAYVTMNWQIRSKESDDTELLVNTQRLDIWKKDSQSRNWSILGTLIYNEERY